LLRTDRNKCANGRRHTAVLALLAGGGSFAADQVTLMLVADEMPSMMCNPLRSLVSWRGTSCRTF
jgi:hypothetical protein